MRSRRLVPAAAHAVQVGGEERMDTETVEPTSRTRSDGGEGSSVLDSDSASVFSIISGD